jgi:hypothetical protein
MAQELKADYDKKLMFQIYNPIQETTQVHAEADG